MEFDSDVLDRETALDSDVDSSDLPLAHRAAATGEVALLVKAVQKDPGLLEQRDRDGYTPLAHAVQTQQLAVVKRLVKMGADINAQDADGRTYLSMAAYQGWYDGVVYLLRKGANQNLCDKSGRTPLHAATYDRDTRTMTSLLQNLSLGEISEADNEKMTVLHWAAFHDRPEHVRQLLLRGVCPENQDMDGKTPLHWAAQNGSSTCCTLLANYHPESKLIRCQDNSGKTAVHLAAAAGHAGILQDLAQFDFSVFEIEDQDDRTPIHWAAAMGHVSCVNALLQMGVTPNPLDVDGGAPLEYARQGGYTECCRLLEKRLGLRTAKNEKLYEGSLDVKPTASKKQNKNPLGFIKGLFRFNSKKDSLDSDEGVGDSCGDVPRDVGTVSSPNRSLSESRVSDKPSRKERKIKEQKNKDEDFNSKNEDSVPDIHPQTTNSGADSVLLNTESIPRVYSGMADASERPRDNEELNWKKKDRKHKRRPRRRHVDRNRSDSTQTATESQQESLPDVQGKGGNARQLTDTSTPTPRSVHHLSPLINARSVSPRVDSQPAYLIQEHTPRRRQRELAPMKLASVDSQWDPLVTPNLSELKQDINGVSRSPTPPPYLTISVNPRKALPGISPLALTDEAEPGKQRNGRKKNKHKPVSPKSYASIHDSPNPSDRKTPYLIQSSDTSNTLASSGVHEDLANPSATAVLFSEQKANRISPRLTGLQRSPSPNMVIRHPSDDNISLYKLSVDRNENRTKRLSSLTSYMYNAQVGTESEEVSRISSGEGKLFSGRK